MLTTYIPEELTNYIEETIGHTDYAPYVLDGQTSATDDSGDDWHDVVTIIDEPNGERAMKFTLDPSGTITHRNL